MKIIIAGIIEKDGKILVAKRRQDARLDGKWEFSGSELESGEFPNWLIEN